MQASSIKVIGSMAAIGFMVIVACGDHQEGARDRETSSIQGVENVMRPNSREQHVNGHESNGGVLDNALGKVNEAMKMLAFSIPSAQDAEEGRSVYVYLTSRLSSPLKFYWKPYVRMTRLTLYGVHKKNKQDDIVRMLQEERQRRGWKPIKVIFLLREVLKHTGVKEGGQLTVRGKEKVLREVMIDRE